ncbi:MAG: alanine--tRNA ligase [Ruminococcaceae bacterium]|nr:alanine--tRNA ligase [Oscillospiraceae bacterium]
MKWTGLNELREKYLSFFESKGHLRMKSFPLVPLNDKSLLLINAGMAPLKPYFKGEAEPPCHRVTTCQKCIRTPDIERVGKTARHGTYFEMLGNFSFGDYFKHEATAWAWEFITKTLEIPADKLYVSVYLEDDEAYDIWTKEIGVAPDHMVRLGKEDNFWEHGAGPCGPCSEIYFDRGPEKGCGSPDCKVGCDCDRFVEFWNLVFTQFDNDGNNNYTRLEKSNIDTGMGLERLACIMQGVDNLFEVDTVQNIMKHISRVANVEYGADKKTDISLRVITDHIRSTTFMVGDGILPSNEGRGYVLRRLLRRAARHGRLLGIKGVFLSEICDTVINENLSEYSELAEKREFIKKVILNEEERFNDTIDAGLAMLNGFIEETAKTDDKVLDGELAFKLYDTYGFPLDLTVDILSERGISVDEKRFDELMQEQRARARAARNADDSAWKVKGDAFKDAAATEFTGYAENESEAEIMAIAVDGELTDAAAEGQSCVVVLNKTPFYGEGGGQIGDIGSIKSESASLTVTDTKKTATGVYLHHVTVDVGMIRVGDKVNAAINAERRDAIRRNHSAAHLLQSALRKVLGNHIEQAGSYVDEHRVRFDFTHFSAMTAQELAETESIVNAEILKGLAVETLVTDIASAKAMGATALFGEKYGDTVRVVKMGDFSAELCGGTHIDNTAKLGLFKLVSESSVASGVRRIEGITGLNVLDYIHKNAELMEQTASALKAQNVNDIATRANAVMAELKATAKTVDELNKKLAQSGIDEIVKNAKEIGGLTVVATELSGVDADTLRMTAELIRDKNENSVVVLACPADGKVLWAACCGKAAVAKGAHAGNIIREAAKITGGGGGGRPDSASAGGRDASKIAQAIDAVFAAIEKI